MTPKEILQQKGHQLIWSDEKLYTEKNVLAAMIEYGNLRAEEMRGKAIDWAAKQLDDQWAEKEFINLILSGKTSTDLECNE